MLARVGLASILLREDAPASWLAETFTEFPRTGKPCSSDVLDIAVMAPGRLANCGILPPAPPHIGDRPPLRKKSLLKWLMFTMRVFAIFTLRK
jgi:hypothetical protein